MSYKALSSFHRFTDDILLQDTRHTKTEGSQGHSQQNIVSQFILMCHNQVKLLTVLKYIGQ
jgi:hypothetical protein